MLARVDGGSGSTGDSLGEAATAIRANTHEPALSDISFH
jgi:hypothetical protein